MSGAPGGPLVARLCVIGVGLIGGSLARALRAAGVVGEIVGGGRSEGNLARAKELGVIDRYEINVGDAADGADMVFVAVPLGAGPAVFGALAGRLADGAVLTDAGSAKGCVVDQVRDAFGLLPGRFVPGHPIAGTEHSGVDASFATLYRQRRVILTPLLETDADALERVRTMWHAAGAEVVDMGVRHHDDVLAATSHLPHMLAYTLVDSLARMDDRVEIFRYAASGFRDFTRIASSDPTMWRDVCLHNREPLLGMLARFRGDLDALTDAVERGDGEALFELFRRTKHVRDNLYVNEAGSDHLPPEPTEIRGTSS